MKLITASGSHYEVMGTSQKGIMVVSKNGGEGIKVIAIFPDRLDAVKAAVTWEKTPDGRMAGFNKAGVRTCLLVTHQAMKGMILLNPKTGFQSTKIVKILG